MRNVALREPHVNSDAPGTPHRRRRSTRISAVVLTVLAVIILILATACGTSDGQPPKATGGTFLVLSLGALVLSVLLLNAVGKAIGQIFDLSLNLLKVIATVGLTAALIIGAVILAVVAVAST